MNKVLTLSLCAVLAFSLVGCVTAEKPVEITKATLAANEETTAPTEETAVPTEESVPGVVENPFDDPSWDEEPGSDNTENKPGNNDSDKPQATQPSGEETQPTQGETQPGEEQDPPAPGTMSYESYNAMSGEAQLAFFNTFATPEDFFAWYNQAKAEYEAAHPDIEVGDGKVDMEDIIGGGN